MDIYNFYQMKQFVKKTIDEFRHNLPSQVVKIARFALKQHKEFLQRDQIRQTNYETFLATQSFLNFIKRIR